MPLAIVFLRPPPEIQHDTGKGRIPFRHDAIAPPPERDRLRPIEDGHQRDAAEGGEMLDQRADERLHALIGHDRDVDPPRVL